ncbi:6-carboxytetrahydropterin synthase [Nitratifractor sp.]|uniref:6-carboxytetrahydropterin synthase n=1 Tax=Nitratifractor sp. TaxID=2268144 RepID=UPI0025E8D603|nr:6-carboxytetrahydropterin synthase [Nitratifractor sp.]
MRWIIDKSFDFCYGHRVWSQSLDKTYSLDECLMCRHLHGHQGRIKIFLSSEILTDGMVTDFKHLNWFKAWLDATLDHKFILDRNDPLFSDLMSHYADDKGKMNEAKFYVHPEGYWTPRLELLTEAPAPLIEKYEGMVIVDFVPTSENLTAWILGIVSDRMRGLGVKVEAVEFWETPKSHCRVETGIPKD